MKHIIPKPIKDSAIVTIPGSKSISHRMLICAALSNGLSTIDNLLLSEDVLLTMDALRQMGAKIDPVKPDLFHVKGFFGHPIKSEHRIYLGNSGTSMRLLAGIAALGNTPFILTGNNRMCERPMTELLDALNLIGIKAFSENTSGTPPVQICGGKREGGHVDIDCSKSSQYLSSLLMIGALMREGLDIHMKQPPVSSPYIHLTMDIMKKFKVESEKISDTHYRVPGRQTYQPQTLFVEPDLSNAGYFWAIGAVSGKMIYVNNISSDSLQGDLKQIHILHKMGCSIDINNDKIGIRGNQLNGIEIDMSDTPDAVPAIAVVASFAKGKTRIYNIRHLREKECDRIDAVSSQLQKMGITVKQGNDFMEISGGSHHAATIETFNDHRIAMAFSIPGLLIRDVVIENESCVEKSFPNYWEIFDAL